MSPVTVHKTPNPQANFIHSTEGKAKVTTPASCLATRGLADSFKKTYSASSRKAIRPVPITVGSSSTSLPASPSSIGSTSTKSNIGVGAIVGGVIEAVIALILALVIAYLCLRSRHQTHNIPANGIEGEKSNPPQSQELSAEHRRAELMQLEIPELETHVHFNEMSYPPPQEHSQSAQDAHVEMPTIHTPTKPADTSDVSSPPPMRTHI
jgi:hypothetical protein